MSRVVRPTVKPLPLRDAAQLFHLLGDPTRLRIVMTLAREGEQTVKDLTAT
jgi:DNA-binding transcriptional ArsR family regulator